MPKRQPYIAVGAIGPCSTCGGSGFSGYGTTYGDVCDGCAGNGGRELIGPQYGKRPAYCPRPPRKRQGKRPAFRNPDPTKGTIRRWELRLLRRMDVDKMTDAQIHAELNHPEVLALAAAVTDEQMALAMDAFYAAGGGAYLRQSK